MRGAAFRFGEQSGGAFHLGNGRVSRSLMRSQLVLVGVALALGCGNGDVASPSSVDAGSTPGQATTDAGAGTWCCWDDDAHTVETCGLPEGGRPLPAFCWDDATPAHPGDS